MNDKHISDKPHSLAQQKFFNSLEPLPQSTGPRPMSAINRSITSSEVSSLRWLLNIARENPNAKIGGLMKYGSMDLPGNSGFKSNMDHLESLWMKIRNEGQ